MGTNIGNSGAVCTVPLYEIKCMSCHKTSSVRDVTMERSKKLFRKQGWRRKFKGWFCKKCQERYANEGIFLIRDNFAHLEIVEEYYLVQKNVHSDTLTIDLRDGFIDKSGNAFIRIRV